MAPAGDLDARQYQLLIALLPQLPRLLRRRFQRQRPHRPSGVGNDAVGAEVHAAVLHLQHGAGTLRHAAGRQHLELAAAQGVVQQRHRLFFVGGLLQKIEKRHPVAGSGNQIQLQSRRLVGVGLDIAAAGGHHGVFVELAAAADHLPGLFVADGGDGAGIDDVGIRRFLKGHQCVAPADKLLLHGLCFILVHLAAKGVNRNAHLALSFLIQYN